MKQKIITAIKRLWQFIRYYFWTKPISKPEPLKATEVIKYWSIVDYHGQKINLHNSEIAYWASMSRKDKRAMAKRFEILEKKGYIKFVEINGKWTCVKNKDYEAKANAE
jgi:hypothetical protein